MTPEEETGEPAKRPMTLAEAGRKGGEKVKKERGVGFYAEIGRKGGRRVAESHGPEFYAEIGRKGGEARRHSGAEGADEPARKHAADEASPPRRPKDEPETEE